MSTLNYVGKYVMNPFRNDTEYCDHRRRIWLWDSSFPSRSFTISELPDRNSSTPTRICQLTDSESLRLHDVLGAWSSGCQDWDPSLLLAHLHHARLSTARSFGRYHRPCQQHGHLPLLHSPVQPNSSLLGRHQGRVLHQPSGILYSWGQPQYCQRCHGPEPPHPRSMEAQFTT